MLLIKLNKYQLSFLALLVFLIALSTFQPSLAADSSIEKTLQKLNAIYERQALDKKNALQEKTKIEAHISKIEAFRATLTLPKDAKADEKARQALAKDKDALQKVEERIRLIDLRINLTQRAIKYLSPEDAWTFNAIRKSLEELRELLKITQDALIGLANARRNEAIEREQWEKTVDAAANAAYERGKVMAAVGIIRFLGGTFEQKSKDANLEIQRAVDMLSGETDPNRREQLHAAIKLLGQQREEIMKAQQVIKRAENMTYGIGHADWATSSSSDLQKSLNNYYTIGKMTLSDPIVQKALKIGSGVGEFAEQAKYITESAYDITAEVVSWKRISQMNKDSEEYLKNVEKLTNRIEFLVDAIKTKEQGQIPTK